MGPGGRCERVGIHRPETAVGPHKGRDGYRLQPDACKGGEDRRVGKAVDGDGVTTSEQRLAGHLNAVLCAAGHGNPVGIRIQAIILEDQHARFTMRFQALRRHKPVQPANSGRPCHPDKAVRKTGVQVRIGKVPGQVADIRFIFRRDQRRNLVRLGRNVGAATGFALDEAPSFGLPVGACDRSERDAQLVGQLALRRQPVALVKRAAADIGFQRIGNRQIDGTLRFVDLRDPHCHGNNVYID